MLMAQSTHTHADIHIHMQYMWKRVKECSHVFRAMDHCKTEVRLVIWNFRGVINMLASCCLICIKGCTSLNSYLY